MQFYTKETPPKTGVAKRIWKALVAAGYDPEEIHFNPGRNGVGGSGTWACALNNSPVEGQCIRSGIPDGEYWCGVCGRNAVYIQVMIAPYGKMLVGFSDKVCPFYKRTFYWPHTGKFDGNYHKESYMGCKYMGMRPRDYSKTREENIEASKPKGCPSDCANCTDEFLKMRNLEYERFKRGKS